MGESITKFQIAPGKPCPEVSRREPGLRKALHKLRAEREIHTANTSPVLVPPPFCVLQPFPWFCLDVTSWTATYRNVKLVLFNSPSPTSPCFLLAIQIFVYLCRAVSGGPTYRAPPLQLVSEPHFSCPFLKTRQSSHFHLKH